jgi:hypothetical protein
MGVSESQLGVQMIDLEQENFHLVVFTECIKHYLLSSTAVRAGEYALRAPSVPPLRWGADSGLPDGDALPEPSESPAAFEKPDFGNLLDEEWSIGQMRYGSNSDRGLLAFLRYFALPRRKLVQSQTSRAVERLWGGKLRRRASYVVGDVGWTSTGRLARDFLLAAWRELSDIYRDLANRRALHRASRIRVKPNNLPVTETGSAAAIAKRINPLGAPPYLVV